MSGNTDVQTKFDVEEEWKKFKEEYNRNYKSEDEEKSKLEIFKKNLEEIASHNEQYLKGELTWYKGVNQFADMTDAEFQNTCCGVRLDEADLPKSN